MYIEFYNFSEKPFDITSNPRFLFFTPVYKEVLASLIYGIQERRGILAIFGEVGTGKTTLLKAAVEHLKDTTHFAFIFNTDADFSEQLELVAEEFELMSPLVNISTSRRINKLKKYAEFKAEKKENVVIIIDEAQNLDYEVFESWRLLSNLESEAGKLIQIVFSGQPELEKKLKEYRLRQLDQRISHRQYIKTLNMEETFNYVKHRLKIAGGAENIFNDNSLKLVWYYSQGVPRKINILCDNVLLIGFALGKKKITEEITREAIEDLTRSPFLDPPGEKKSSLPIAAQTPSAKNSHNPDGPIKGTYNRFRVTLAAGFFICIAVAAGIYFYIVL